MCVNNTVFRRKQYGLSRQPTIFIKPLIMWTAIHLSAPSASAIRHTITFGNGRINTCGKMCNVMYVTEASQWVSWKKKKMPVNMMMIKWGMNEWISECMCVRIWAVCQRLQQQLSRFYWIHLFDMHLHPKTLFKYRFRDNMICDEKVLGCEKWD